MKRKPALFSMLDWFFDVVLIRVRWLLLPFHLLIMIFHWGQTAVFLLNNEYLKRQLGGCGSGVRIHGRFRVTAPRHLIIGHNVHINDNAFLRAEGGLTIGDNVHISRNLVIYTMNHNYEGDLLPYDAEQIHKPVQIDRNVWIGMNVCITPGVKIGEGAIIGMGTTVTKDVPPLAIVGSAPQRILKSRNKSHYHALNDQEAFGGMSGHHWQK